MIRAITSIASLLVLTVPAYAATSTQKAAVTALVAAEHKHGNSDIENPSCYVVQTWAQCVYGTASGHVDAYAWLHFRSGKWVYVGHEIGNPVAPYLKQYGIPPAIAKQFLAQCKC